MSSQAAAVPMLATCTVMKRKAGMPQCGGVNTFTSEDIAWTGGNPYDSNIMIPAANGCYRPMELDKAQKVEDKCLQLNTKTGQKQVPLMQWMKDVQAHLMTNGLDGVPYIIDAKTNSIQSLLEQWSKIIINDITEWIKAKPWDFYDMDNLQMSSKFL